MAERKAPMTTAVRDHRQIRGWERMLITILGFMLVGGSSAPAPWGYLMPIVGWTIVAAAVGVVELAMALWYRARRPA